MRQLRIRRYTTNGGWGSYQLLQEKRWWGWKTIDREDIPEYAIISRGAFGDWSGWVSKFVKYGTFGPDGRMIKDYR